MSGFARRLKIFERLINISALIRIIIPKIAVHIIFAALVLLSSISDIKGSLAAASKSMPKSEKTVFKKAERFLIESFLRRRFASFSSVNSSLGMYSSNSDCSSCTSFSSALSTVSGRPVSSPVKSIGLVCELTLILAVLSASDTGVNLIVAVLCISGPSDFTEEAPLSMSDIIFDTFV